jgi:uncharacterized membrane protein YphA (DoxX/SURF4 family)
MLLGAVLLVAAWAKLLDPNSFAAQIHAEGLDFLLSADTVALIALGLEVGLGLALLLGVRRLWVLVPSALLVAFFLFLTGRTYVLAQQGLLEEVSSCGCFGNLVERTPAQAFWQDLLLLVPALLLAFWGRVSLRREEPRPRRFPPWRTAVAAVGTVAALGFAHYAPSLPLDNLATRLRPGARISELCTGTEEARYCLSLVAPELEQGRHVVVMADLDEEEAAAAFAEAVPDLNQYTLDGRGPRLWVLAELTPEQLNRIYWQWGPAFEIREAPEALLRPLYRTLPRSFLVEDGRVTRTFSGMPPLTEIAAVSAPAAPVAGTPGSGSDAT